MWTLEDWLFWGTEGDWHLDPQRGEHGEVAVNVWEGLDEGREEMLEV